MLAQIPGVRLRRNCEHIPRITVDSSLELVGETHELELPVSFDDRSEKPPTSNLLSRFSQVHFAVGPDRVLSLPIRVLRAGVSGVSEVRSAEATDETREAGRRGVFDLIPDESRRLRVWRFRVRRFGVDKPGKFGRV